MADTKGSAEFQRVSSLVSILAGENKLEQAWAPVHSRMVQARVNDSFSGWVLAATGAAVGLFLSNGDVLTKSIGPVMFEWAMRFLVLSGLIGGCAKFLYSQASGLMGLFAEDESQSLVRQESLLKRFSRLEALLEKMGAKPDENHVHVIKNSFEQWKTSEENIAKEEQKAKEVLSLLTLTRRLVLIQAIGFFAFVVVASWKVVRF